MADALKITVIAKPQLDELAEQHNLTEREVQQIGTAGINRSLPSIQSRVVKRLAGVVNLKQKEIRESILIKKASYEKMDGSVVVSRKPIPLFDFPHKGGLPGDGTEGVSVKVRKNKGWELLKSTFIATMPKTGHTGIFERVRKDGVGAKTGFIEAHLLKFPGRASELLNAATTRFGRLPIIERFGLTLTGYMANTPGVIAEETAAAGEIFGKNILSQLQRRLAQRKPPH